MIFVTVGTAHYDPLIRRMDKLVEEGKIEDRIIGQIGRGRYEPSNFRYFRFISSLEPAYKAADVIVSTGGAGTTMECVQKGLKLVVIENTTLMEGHQSQLIGEMARRGHLLWCKDLEDLPKRIKEAKGRSFDPFVSDKPRAHLYILKMLQELREC
ncbi:MAG: PssE/Cps14G family polysaccharide biosynthesis glycosyltransferase [Candidatus Thorarchaeota archaeon]